MDARWDSDTDIYFVLLRLFYESNPIGIAGSANRDEYRHEVRRVLDELPMTTSTQGAVRTVYRAFVDGFNENIAGPYERYESLGEAVWKAWRQHVDDVEAHPDAGPNSEESKLLEGPDIKPSKARLDPTIGRKGRLVEKIVQWLYEGMPNAQILPREFLLTIDGTRECEIDVLITVNIEGLEVRTAVECKNEQRPIGKTHMQHFVNKLNAVGIPTNLGLFVSRSRYTSEALRIARRAGIKPLLVDNLTADRLASQVAQVIQAVVFLQATVITMHMVDGSTSAFQTPEEYGLYDEHHRYAGTLLDQIWSGWLTGGISSQPGKHIVQMDIPEGWYRPAGDRRYPIQATGAVIQVDGLVLDITGTFKAHSLQDANEGTVQRFRQEAVFKLPEGEHVLRVLATKAELQQYLDKIGPTVVVYRKLPRIRYGPAYWPPSDRVVRVMKERMGPLEPGVMPEPLSLQFEELEGTNVLQAWEPITSEYFAEQTDSDAPQTRVSFHDFLAPSDAS